MAFTATLGFEEGCTILSFDGANAFNSIYRHRFLPALAEIVPSVVPYASNLYASTTSRSFYHRNFLSIWQRWGKLRNGCRDAWG